jgi:hypothetical protein
MASKVGERPGGDHMKERIQPYFWLLAIALFAFTVVFIVGGRWWSASGTALSAVAATWTWLDYRKRYRTNPGTTRP